MPRSSDFHIRSCDTLLRILDPTRTYAHGVKRMGFVCVCVCVQGGRGRTGGRGHRRTVSTSRPAAAPGGPSGAAAGPKTGQDTPPSHSRHTSATTFGVISDPDDLSVAVAVQQAATVAAVATKLKAIAA